MLLRPAMRPIARFASRLRAETGRPVPDADPLDGGTEATLLLLLERPAAAVVGFVSRDNPTPTARNIRRFTEAAGLPRTATLIWNAVPWMDGAPDAGPGRPRNRAPRPDEIHAGLLWLPPLLDLLPRLQVVVLAGRVARLAAGTLQAAQPELLVLTMPHPSPTIVCTSPRVGERILDTLAAAAAALGQGPTAEAGGR